MPLAWKGIVRVGADNAGTQLGATWTPPTAAGGPHHLCRSLDSEPVLSVSDLSGRCRSLGAVDSLAFEASKRALCSFLLTWPAPTPDPMPRPRLCQQSLRSE